MTRMFGREAKRLGRRAWDAAVERGSYASKEVRISAGVKPVDEDGPAASRAGPGSENRTFFFGFGVSTEGDVIPSASSTVSSLTEKVG